jgi:hypothetical protein
LPLFSPDTGASIPGIRQVMSSRMLANAALTSPRRSDSQVASADACSLLES